MNIAVIDTFIFKKSSETRYLHFLAVENLSTLAECIQKKAPILFHNNFPNQTFEITYQIDNSNIKCKLQTKDGGAYVYLQGFILSHHEKNSLIEAADNVKVKTRNEYFTK